MENKEIYICGDFNIDLLKMDQIINYRKFYELMSSYGLLPHILYPTREFGDTSTIIDNIFFFTDLSDHSQFIMVNREKLDLKKVTVYSRDNSKFSADISRDVTIQNFNVKFDNVNDQFNDFYFKLEGCVDRRAPLKKLNPKETKLMNKPWICNVNQDDKC